MPAVVFDFDGVLARSMEQHAEAFRRTLEPLGIDVPQRRVFELEGMPSRAIIRLLLEENDVEADVGRLADAKQAAFEAMGTPGLFDGARALLQQADGHPRAIVTGTRRENVAAILGDLGVVDFVLADGDYDEPKPSPAPYLAAAERLARAPADCVVLENAPLGIRSAKAAGCRVLAVATTLSPEDLAAADEVHGDHEALRAALQRILDGA